MARLKRAGAARSRPATYHTAMRVARIVHGLMSRPFGWSFAAIQDELGISERTLLRYLAASRRELVDADGEPIVEVVRHGDRRVLRLVSATRTPESSSYQALLFYFAASVLQALDGTVLKEGVQDLWESFYRMLPPDQQRRLAGFDRKFFTVPYLAKDYRAFDERLDTILRCLVHQYTLRIVYESPWRGAQDPEPQDFDPYTLAMYRGGLYLIGRSHKHRRIVYLAVERMRTVTKLARHFDYPARYSPVRHTEGTFGIVDGPETDVAIRIPDPDGAALLRARRLHPTQQFHQQPDGSMLLTMTVRGTAELENWVLSLGPHAEVLAPAELRARVAAALEAAAAQYRDEKSPAADTRRRLQ
ncbi:MAG TPA: WYL domain-containing protein [Candidatus Binatia bacterium]|nr:WYL domain-containing protein [Candidatus Binatia bacterium]